MTIQKTLMAALVLIIELQSICYSQFMLVSEKKVANVFVSAAEPDFVKSAVQDLASDTKKITGQNLQIVSDLRSCTGNCVVVGTITNLEAENVISASDKSVTDDIKGRWEAYRVITLPVTTKATSILMITGSDARGTMFGVYDFIQNQLGVDPLYFWKDREPAKKSILVWKKIDTRVDGPTFKFRGWFINDEDLLTEWMESGGARKLDYPYYSQVVSPQAIKHVFEAMVRLRMNLVIPASFIDIDKPAEAGLVEEASKRGLFLSMHHVEPMGVSAFTFFNYWEKRGRKPLFSFYSSRKELLEVWKYYASKWAKYSNVIWQVGLRGIADRPMWMADPNTPQSDADRGALISEAISLQIDMIKAVDKRPVPLITTTLWAEGSQFFSQGFLKIPENVICIFSDNSPGWRWQKDFNEIARQSERKYGVYYHHQLWSSGPHLVQSVPPVKTYKVLGAAVNNQSDEYAIMNVSNIREFVLGLHASAEMLYDFKDFKPAAFMQNWGTVNFGRGASVALEAYQIYFDAFQTPDAHPVPFLLDGHIKSKGTNLLKKLSLQIADPAKYKLNEEKEKQVVQEKSWGGSHLSDMNPIYDGQEELKNKLATQQAGFRRAYTYALQAQEKMASEQYQFLETNLVSQLHVMKGLGEWLTQVVNASDAYQQNNKASSINYLKQALTAFDEIKSGMKINSRGKWEHWYRGDKKMNIEEMLNLTKTVIAQLQKPGV